MAKKTLANGVRATHYFDTPPEPPLGRSLRYTLRSDGVILVQWRYQNRLQPASRAERVPASHTKDMTVWFKAWAGRLCGGEVHEI